MKNIKVFSKNADNKYMKIGPRPQSLSSEEYRLFKDSLNGIFSLRENITFNSILHFKRYSTVFLKNGLPHHEDGPAVLSQETSKDKGYLIGYYLINGQWAQLINKPNTMKFEDPYIWNGSFYEAPDSTILESARRDKCGKLHNLLGPAFYKKSIGKNHNLYYIEGNKLTRIQWARNPLVIHEHSRVELKIAMNESFKE